MGERRSPDASPDASVLAEGPRPLAGDSLTRRAGLSFLTQAVRLVLRAVAAFVATPIILRIVGIEAFGLWTVIQKTSAYVSLADFRAAGATKLLLAVRQHETEPTHKQRVIGASLVVWLIFLPVLLVASGALLLFADRVLPIDPTTAGIARTTLAIVLVGLVLGRVAALPGNVLGAANLGYRALPAEIVTPVLTAALMIGALHAGLGLPGLALATLVGLLADGALRHVIARRDVTWYGVRRPSQEDFRGFTAVAGWMQFSNLGNLLLWGADAIILGKLLGASAAAVYVQTGFVVRLSTEAIGMLFTSGKSGLVGLIGEGERERADKVRAEMHLLAAAAMTFTGALVLALNASFVTLWLGAELFAGPSTNAFLVAGSFLAVYARNEAMVLDGMLAVGRKSLAMVVSGVITVALGLVLTLSMGISGMALAWMTGQFVLSALSWAMIRFGSGAGERSAPATSPLRLILAPVLLVAAHLSSTVLRADDWLGFVVRLVAISGVVGAVVWFGMLTPSTRSLVVTRIAVVARPGAR